MGQSSSHHHHHHRPAQQIQQLPLLNPQQQQTQAIANPMAQQMMQQMANRPPFDFGPIQQQVQQQYDENIVPSILSRFSNMHRGTGDSSGLARALAGGGRSLATTLAAMREQSGQQQRGLDQSQLGQLLGVGMQPSFQNYDPYMYSRGQQQGGGGGGFGSNFMSGLSGHLANAALPIAGTALGAAFGMPWLGPLLGGATTAMSEAGGLFGKRKSSGPQRGGGGGLLGPIDYGNFNPYMPNLVGTPQFGRW